MFHTHDVEEAIRAVNATSRKKSSYRYVKLLMSPHGLKQNSSQRTYLIQDTRGMKAVMRLSHEPFREPLPPEARLHPKTIASDAIHESQPIYYHVEEFIHTDPDFLFSNKHIQNIFTEYTSARKNEYIASNRRALKAELDALIQSFTFRYTSRPTTTELLFRAADRYVTRKRQIRYRHTYLDLVPSNILHSGSKFYIIDQEYGANSHFPVIEYLRFMYHHLAQIHSDTDHSKEKLLEYTMLCLLLPQSQYAHMTDEVLADCYDEDPQDKPFLFAIMYMYEMNLQYEVHSPMVNAMEVHRSDIIIRELLSPHGAKTLYRFLTGEDVHDNQPDESVALSYQTEIQYLRHSLDTIQNSRVYKVWQTYCALRDRARAALKNSRPA